MKTYPMIPQLSRLLSKSTIYLGIDPGAMGGLAVLYPSLPLPQQLAIRTTAKVSLGELRDWLAEHACPVESCLAVLEKVHAFPGQGVTSMFSFGENYGRLQGLLTALRIPYELAPPETWQKALGIPRRGRGESKADFKRRLADHASRLFPSTEIPRAAADAVLLAEYARRQREGTKTVSAAEGG